MSQLFRGVIHLSSITSLLLVAATPTLSGFPYVTASEQIGEDILNTVRGGRVYTPPPNSRTSEENHTSAGVRGCGVELAALAPRFNFVGQAISTRPTFVWYVFGERAVSLEFNLYHYQSDGTLEAVLTEPVGQSAAGYMTYTLPPNQPALTPGDTYLWRVVMYCNQDLETIGGWTSADIEIVDTPIEFATSDFTENNSLLKAQVYAEAGLWYDALAEVYDASTSAEKAFQQDLLLDLADLEEQSGSLAANGFSTQLRQIAERIAR